MAVTCWLTANVSTWASASSVIYYYDETEPVEEDRIKPYNSLPKPGDTFYMNGYNNTQASGYTVNIPDGIIRNDLNPYTGRTGGQATGTGNNGTVNYICKEIHVGDTVFHSQGSNGNATINVTGDIYCEGTAAFFYKAGNGVLYLRVTGNVYRGPSAALTTAYTDRGGNVVINGNYYGYNVISTSGMNGSVTINGNVEMFANRLCGQTHSSVVIYGSVKLHDNAYLSNVAQTGVAIYGNITLEGQDLFTVKATTVSFYGDKITYSNFDPLKTLFFTNNLNVYSEQLEIERTDDYGESVLISKYQLDNTDQYPAETNVRKDVPYAFGTKIGQLEPVTVDSRNTINVYPYAKRVI